MANRAGICMIAVVGSLLSSCTFPAAAGKPNSASAPNDMETAVDALVSDGSLARSFDEVRCSNGYVPFKATLYLDKSNVVRKYVTEGGTGDSARSTSYYYGPTGVLRYFFYNLKAANGTEYEVRASFDQEGRRIDFQEVTLSGPGWASDGPTEVSNPVADFRSLQARASDYRQACGEN